MAIRERKGKWLAVVFRGYEVGPDGKQRRLEHARTFKLKKDAERWVREQQGQLDRQEWVAPSALTLNQFLDQWEAGALKLGPQRERTKAGYVWLLKTYVRPALGSVKLAQLTKGAVQRMAAELLARPVTSGGKPAASGDGEPVPTLSPVTVRRTLAALSVALHAAVEQRLLATNPAQGITLPRAERVAVRWLTREEVGRLLDGTRDDRHGALWTVLALTGMRPGEALGLGWAHVDLAAGVIRVQRALVPAKEKGSTWRVDEPKTRRSRRAIPISEEVVRALRGQRVQQAADRLAAGGAYREHDAGGFVFARPDGEPHREDALLQVFQRTLARLALPRTTLYALRHGHASLLLEAGAPLKVVSERLGHASIQLTADTYSHVSDQLQQRAVEQLTTYLAARAGGEGA